MMRTVRLPDGTEVPALGQGTWHMGERGSAAKAEAAAIRLGIELRKKLRAVAREYAEKYSDPAHSWFFDPFVPDVVTLRDGAGKTVPTRWEDVPTDRLAIDPTMWELTPGAGWHGFDHLVPSRAAPVDTLTLEPMRLPNCR